MPARTRTIIVAVLILLGGALFCYCAIFYPAENAAQAADASPTLSAS